ncbi:HD domain-containing phosphohydrolase [Desulfocurvus sp. DL9XJH121]
MHSILIVDDDKKLLSSFQRVLCRRFTAQTACNGKEALALLAGGDEFSVVISDYKMPEMNGLEFLAKARDAAPDMVRIMLTGYADLDLALKAVNESGIFRLLTKPCNPKDLALALKDAIRYHEALVAEAQLLDQTLRSSVGLLADVISLVRPDIFSRTSRMLPTVHFLARCLAQAGDWEIETAAHLSMLGFVTLPDSIVAKVLAGKPLAPVETPLFEDHPTFAAQFISRVPRMGHVARIVSYQLKNYDGTGPPADGVSGEDIPLGARIIRVAADYDAALCSGAAKGDALTLLLKREGRYDQKVLDALADLIGEEGCYALRKYHLLGLQPGMVLAADLVAKHHRKKILAKGQVITEMLIEYLLRYSKRDEIQEPIQVIEPLTCTL